MLDNSFFDRAIMSLKAPGEVNWERPYKTERPPEKLNGDFGPLVEALEAIPVCSGVAKLLRKIKAKVMIGNVDPHYDVLKDRIVLPHPSMFISEECFYHSLFHELGHWTGKRMKRSWIDRGRASKKEMDMEEMVAELVAVFLCAFFGIKGYASSVYLTVFGENLDKFSVQYAMALAVDAARFLLKEVEP